MLEEMDDDFGVSNVVNEAFSNVAKVKVKKEPVSVVFYKIVAFLISQRSLTIH